MLKSTNYVVIPAWAINHLEMNPTELIVFSVIYGFSQDGLSAFTGSATYLSKVTNVSRQTVMGTLKKLCEKNYIKKIENVVNGVSMPMYMNNVDTALFTYPTDDEALQGVKNFDRGCKEIEHNNTSNKPSDSEKNAKENPRSQVCGKATEEEGVCNVPTAKSVAHAEDFEKPTVEQCVQYCREAELIINPYYFHSFYGAMNWKDSTGKKVKNWKLKMRTWNAKAVANGDDPWDGVSKTTYDHFGRRKRNHQTETDGTQLERIGKASESQEDFNGIF